MSKYTILLSGSIKRDDGVCIPTSIDNRDYQEYQSWISQGNSSHIEVESVKTTTQCVEEAYNYWSSQGWVKYLLDAMPARAAKKSNGLTEDQHALYDVNVSVIETALSLAISNPSSFVASNYALPNLPSEFGL